MSVARTEFVRTGGVRLRVRREGSGPSLVLINGIGAPLEMWAPFVRQMRGYTITTFDLPGCGLSSTSWRAVGMRALAGIVERVMCIVGQSRAHVLGYSLGGFVAQELARRHPERVDRLILCATTPGWPSLPPQPLAALMMLWPTRYRDAEAALRIVPRIAGGRTRRDNAVLHENIRLRLSHPPTVTGYLQQLHAASRFSSHPWLRRVPHRTLVLCGDDDPLVPLANPRYLAWALSDAQLHIMRGAGHLMLLDQPREAAAVARRFLEA